MSRATPNWLISSQKFTNIDSGKSFYSEATRGRCDFGLFPANGLVYGSIGEQCNCELSLAKPPDRADPVEREWAVLVNPEPQATGHSSPETAAPAACG